MCSAPNSRASLGTLCNYKRLTTNTTVAALLALTTVSQPAELLDEQGSYGHCLQVATSSSVLLVTFQPSIAFYVCYTLYSLKQDGPDAPWLWETDIPAAFVIDCALEMAAQYRLDSFASLTASQLLPEKCMPLSHKDDGAQRMAEVPVTPAVGMCLHFIHGLVQMHHAGQLFMPGSHEQTANKPAARPGTVTAGCSKSTAQISVNRSSSEYARPTWNVDVWQTMRALTPTRALLGLHFVTKLIHLMQPVGLPARELLLKISEFLNSWLQTHTAHLCDSSQGKPNQIFDQAPNPADQRIDLPSFVSQFMASAVSNLGQALLQTDASSQANPGELPILKRTVTVSFTAPAHIASLAVIAFCTEGQSVAAKLSTSLIVGLVSSLGHACLYNPVQIDSLLQAVGSALCCSSSLAQMSVAIPMCQCTGAKQEI